MIHKVVLKAVAGAIVGVVTFTVIGHSFHPASAPRNELEAVLPHLLDEGPHRGADGTVGILDLKAPAVSGSCFGGETHDLRLGEGLAPTDRDGVNVRLYFA